MHITLFKFKSVLMVTLILSLIISGGQSPLIALSPVSDFRDVSNTELLKNVKKYFKEKTIPKVPLQVIRDLLMPVTIFTTTELPQSSPTLDSSFFTYTDDGRSVIKSYNAWKKKTSTIDTIETAEIKFGKNGLISGLDKKEFIFSSSIDSIEWTPQDGLSFKIADQNGDEWSFIFYYNVIDWEYVDYSVGSITIVKGNNELTIPVKKINADREMPPTQEVGIFKKMVSIILSGDRKLWEDEPVFQEWEFRYFSLSLINLLTQRLIEHKGETKNLKADLDWMVDLLEYVIPQLDFKFNETRWNNLSTGKNYYSDEDHFIILYNLLYELKSQKWFQKLPDTYKINIDRINTLLEGPYKGLNSFLNVSKGFLTDLGLDSNQIEEMRKSLINERIVASKHVLPKADVLVLKPSEVPGDYTLADIIEFLKFWPLIFKNLDIKNFPEFSLEIFKKNIYNIPFQTYYENSIKLGDQTASNHFLSFIAEYQLLFEGELPTSLNETIKEFVGKGLISKLNPKMIHLVRELIQDLNVIPRNLDPFFQYLYKKDINDYYYNLEVQKYEIQNIITFYNSYLENSDGSYTETKEKIHDLIELIKSDPNFVNFEIFSLPYNFFLLETSDETPDGLKQLMKKLIENLYLEVFPNMGLSKEALTFSAVKIGEYSPEPYVGGRYMGSYITLELEHLIGWDGDEWRLKEQNFIKTYGWEDLRSLSVRAIFDHEVGHYLKDKIFGDFTFPSDSKKEGPRLNSRKNSHEFFAEGFTLFWEGTSYLLKLQDFFIEKGLDGSDLSTFLQLIFDEFIVEDENGQKNLSFWEANGLAGYIQYPYLATMNDRGNVIKLENKERVILRKEFKGNGNISYTAWETKEKEKDLSPPEKEPQVLKFTIHNQPIFGKIPNFVNQSIETSIYINIFKSTLGAKPEAGSIIRIYDINGKVVKAFDPSNPASELKIHLAKGVYTYKGLIRYKGKMIEPIASKVSQRSKKAFKEPKYIEGFEPREPIQTIESEYDFMDYIPFLQTQKVEEKDSLLNHLIEKNKSITSV